ncbi:MAG: D-alanine--poly(phosphoribitol) ligase subunit DltA [Lachnospiraceae bacterium]|nr:D-alanine--poly(phosphoribitol) ligase subunit DltA [Lachnospiraceae bacterium]
MTDFLEKIKEHSLNDPEGIFYELAIPGEDAKSLTYGQLWKDACALAGYLDETLKTTTPVVVYGHKDPMMIVCFLGALLSGRGYCPVDISVPEDRVRGIIANLAPEMILCPCDEPGPEGSITLSEIRNITETHEAISSGEKAISGDDVCYIIYTSGSTGTPKGVQITGNCLDNFIKWGMGLGSGIADGEKPKFLNQAPFSFDLSVMDLYLSLYSGGTLHVLPKKVQADMGLLMGSLEGSMISIWVSTPSFAEVCLSDKSFGGQMLPSMKRFLFCGETLPPAVVRKLKERFPGAEVVNTYGPTESTVAVTDVTVTDEICDEYDPLPVGKIKPGSELRIRNEKGEDLPEGESGEIIILGDTVSIGYRGLPEQTEKAFFEENGVRGYRTGDKGYIRNSQLFYQGRIDLQIKLHGYRIELEDIENNLMKIEGVEKATVLPIEKDGKISSLTACIIPDAMPESAFKEGQRLRSEAKAFLPEYMIPRKFLFFEELPMTGNGKTDRRALLASLQK